MIKSYPPYALFLLDDDNKEKQADEKVADDFIEGFKKGVEDAGKDD